MPKAGIRSRKSEWAAGALALILGVAWGQALPQDAPQPIPQSTETALHAMSQQAAVIFAGQVTAVRRRDGSNGASGIVEIDFAVDDAIRGADSGTYTLREWAGLWPAGDEPFRTGQRYLMLLHAPGPAGLSSPVGGPDGAIPIRGAVSTQPDARIVDLRWVATRAVRPASDQPTFIARPIGRPILVHPSAVVAAPGGDSGLSTTLPTATPTTSVAPDDAYGTVLAMLRAWERDDHATR